jgi:hypothetical protein
MCSDQWTDQPWRRSAQPYFRSSTWLWFDGPSWSVPVARTNRSYNCHISSKIPQHFLQGSSFADSLENPFIPCRFFFFWITIKLHSSCHNLYLKYKQWTTPAEDAVRFDDPTSADRTVMGRLGLKALHRWHNFLHFCLGCIIEDIVSRGSSSLPTSGPSSSPAFPSPRTMKDCLVGHGERLHVGRDGTGVGRHCGSAVQVSHETPVITSCTSAACGTFHDSSYFKWYYIYPAVNLIFVKHNLWHVNLDVVQCAAIRQGAVSLWNTMFLEGCLGFYDLFDIQTVLHLHGPGDNIWMNRYCHHNETDMSCHFLSCTVWTQNTVIV